MLNSSAVSSRRENALQFVPNINCSIAIEQGLCLDHWDGSVKNGGFEFFKKGQSVDAVADTRNASIFDVAIEVYGVKVMHLIYGGMEHLTGSLLKSRPFSIMCEAEHSNPHRKQHRTLKYIWKTDRWGQISMRWQGVR